jgi:NADH-quinone oxidoreductase subunit F
MDLVLDYSAPNAEGCSLGSGGIVVLDERCCVVDFVLRCLQFYEKESCGKCYPCRIGTVRLREFVEGITGRTPASYSPTVVEEVKQIQEVMERTSACGLGVSVPLLLSGLYRFFPREIEEHIAGFCRTEVCKL